MFCGSCQGAMWHPEQEIYCIFLTSWKKHFRISPWAPRACPAQQPPPRDAHFSSGFVESKKSIGRRGMRSRGGRQVGFLRIIHFYALFLPPGSSPALFPLFFWSRILAQGFIKCKEAGACVWTAWCWQGERWHAAQEIKVRFWLIENVHFWTRPGAPRARPAQRPPPFDAHCAGGYAEHTEGSWRGGGRAGVNGKVWLFGQTGSVTRPKISKWVSKPRT
jgi:hypothetical protein